MNKLYIFQQDDSFCPYYITFAESKILAKQKVLDSIFKKLKEAESDEYYKQHYEEILYDKWIVKEIEDNVFEGEWC